MIKEKPSPAEAQLEGGTTPEFTGSAELLSGIRVEDESPAVSAPA
jgi:hypothetical protein